MTPHDELEILWVCPRCGRAMTDIQYSQIRFNFLCLGGCRYRLSNYEPKTVSRPVTPDETTDGSGEPT